MHVYVSADADDILVDIGRVGFGSMEHANFHSRPSSLECKQIEEAVTCGSTAAKPYKDFRFPSVLLNPGRYGRLAVPPPAVVHPPEDENDIKAATMCRGLKGSYYYRLYRTAVVIEPEASKVEEEG